MPISYGDLLILRLHDNCFRVLALSPTATSSAEPAKNPELDTGMYNRYCKFEVAYKARLEHLMDSSTQFEKPEVVSADKCMPRLL
jgi:hypothetical protein